MKYLGKITDNKDLVTKEYVDSSIPTDISAFDNDVGYIAEDSNGDIQITRNIITGGDVYAAGYINTESGVNSDGDLNVAGGFNLDGDAVMNSTLTCYDDIITETDVIDGAGNVLADKQDTLVSGTNIKTVNNQSLLGSGNITVCGTRVVATTSGTVSVNNNTWTKILQASIPAGVWIVNCGVRFPAGSTGVRCANLSTSSGNSFRMITAMPVTAGFTTLNFTKVIWPTATTTYYLNAYHTQGSALTIPDAEGTYINAVKVG